MGASELRNPPDIDATLRAADEGEPMALQRAYGMAAAWLRDGRCPPAPLGDWIAVRLDEVGAAIREDFPGEPASKRYVRIATALHATRPGGRPGSRHKAAVSYQILQEMRQLIDGPRYTVERAAAKIAEDYKRNGIRSPVVSTRVTTLGDVMKIWRDHTAPKKMARPSKKNLDGFFFGALTPW